MRRQSSRTQRVVVAALILALSASLGCATARARPDETRFLAVSAADSVTTYLAMERGATERNPLYRSSDALTVAATSFAVSVAATWALHRVTKKLPPHKRKKLWFATTTLRGLGIPFNVNAALQAEDDR